jgi:hypothetical protein
MLDLVMTVVWTVAGVALIVLAYQALMTAKEAESLLHGLRRNLVPILENHRTTSEHVRATAEIVHKGILRPVHWAASAWATVRGVANWCGRKDGEDHGGT